jgi:hypothetical protein
MFEDASPIRHACQHSDRCHDLWRYASASPGPARAPFVMHGTQDRGARCQARPGGGGHRGRTSGKRKPRGPGGALGAGEDRSGEGSGFAGCTQGGESTRAPLRAPGEIDRGRQGKFPVRLEEHLSIVHPERTPGWPALNGPRPSSPRSRHRRRVELGATRPRPSARAPRPRSPRPPPRALRRRVRRAPA